MLRLAALLLRLFSAPALTLTLWLLLLTALLTDCYSLPDCSSYPTFHTQIFELRKWRKEIKYTQQETSSNEIFCPQLQAHVIDMKDLALGKVSVLHVWGCSLLTPAYVPYLFTSLFPVISFNQLISCDFFLCISK